MKKPKSYQAVIGETIEQLRTDKGWTQEELAKAVGSSQSAIHRIEKGGQNISLEMIKKLSEALGNQFSLSTIPFLKVFASVAAKNFPAKLLSTHQKMPPLVYFAQLYLTKAAQCSTV